MKTKGNFHFSAAHSNLTMLQTNTNAAQAVRSITLAQQLKRSSAAPTNHNNSLAPLSPLVSLALPFPLSLRKSLRPVKLVIGIRLLDGLWFQPPPLSALTPSAGPGSSGMSPEFVESRTPTPGLPPVPLAPLNPLPSPVTLLQVEDVVATSNMVQELHSCHHPPPLLSSFNLPPSLEMAVDEAKDSLLAWSHA